MVRKKAGKRKVTSVKQHKGLDDYMVTGVLIACGIAVLILISTFLTVTGLAVAGTPDTIGVTTVLQEAELVSGSGTMQCNYACARAGKYAMVSSVNNELVENSDIVSGDWTCLCGSVG